MLTFLIVFLVSSSIAFDENQTIQNQEPDNKVISFIIRKSLEIEEKTMKNWDKNLNDFIEEQLHDNRRGKTSDWRDEIRNGTFHNDLTKTYSKDNLKSITEKLDSIYGSLQNISGNYNSLSLSQIESRDICNDEVCKIMVGLSKPPTCQYVKTINKSIPTSCREIKKNGRKKSGIYEIQPTSSVDPFMVFCDMETRGGGWTVIQNRFDGSEDFYRDWRDYKFGFGNLNREYWIGLEHIYHITTFETSELLVELTDREKNKAYAHYNRFAVGPEKNGYPLNDLEGFSGDAGDSLNYHLNEKFTTRDMDQDSDSNKNCAETYRGAWWHKRCFYSSLNGKFINLDLPKEYLNQGIHWNGFRAEYCLAGSKMMVRPVQS